MMFDNADDDNGDASELVITVIVIGTIWPLPLVLLLFHRYPKPIHCVQRSASTQGKAKAASEHRKPRRASSIEVEGRPKETSSSICLRISGKHGRSTTSPLSSLSSSSLRFRFQRGRSAPSSLALLISFSGNRGRSKT